jgi:alginate O-acetyltransferase complex protein AlgI
MVFSSVTFLFLFLPIVLACYCLAYLPVWFGSGKRVWWHLCNLYLLAVSLVFYFWGEKFLIWVFVATVLIDFVCALLISGAYRRGPYTRLQPKGVRTRFQKTVLIVSICSNMALLGYFKYFNFGVETYNSVVTAAGFTGSAWTDAPKVLLPLGISFFVFHSMSYTIDVYRGFVTATRNVVDYACYVLMFPQLVAGPIVRYSAVARQLVERRLTAPVFASGVARFVAGLAKKVLIANTVSVVADRIFALRSGQVSFSIAWLGVMAYSVQIYFDFSGYSDMAIGLGRMLGFELPINFNYPYFASSIREFWRRWHISLSTWFQDYLYIPLGGSRHGQPSTYVNLVTVFFLCGLWHGAKWTFVAWGLYHGVFLVLERFGLGAAIGRIRPLNHLYALLVVMGGWVLFRASTFSQALEFWRALAGLTSVSATYPIGWFAGLDFITAVGAGIVLSAPVVPAALRRLEQFVADAPEGRRAFYRTAFSTARVTAACAAMVACAVFLASGTHNPFIYFRF